MVDASLVAMYGHHSASYPDPFLPQTTRSQQRALQGLPPDPSGNSIGVPYSPQLQRAASQRLFAGGALPLELLGSILVASYGLVGMGRRRTVPSAGAMFPLTHHLLVLSDRGEERAARYQMSRHRNALIDVGPLLRDDISGCLYGLPENTHAVHVITFDLARSAAKYGSRAHRFALVEAGHAAQMALLHCAEIGVAACEWGGYRDAPLQRMLKIPYATAGIATSLIYGLPL